MYLYVCLSSYTYDVRESKRQYLASVPALGISIKRDSEQDVILSTQKVIKSSLTKGMKPKHITLKQIKKDYIFFQFFIVNTKDFTESKLFLVSDVFDDCCSISDKYVIKLVDENIILERQKQFMIGRIKKLN